MLRLALLACSGALPISVPAQVSTALRAARAPGRTWRTAPFPFGEPRPRFDDTPRETREEAQVASATGALLRGLDKVSGEVTDLDMSVGETVRLGRLDVTLGDCRYPVDDPSGDAFAFLTIEVEGLSEPAFEGWMIASSPALSALDHPRYDVWVMRCRSS
jgi:hypothetical protein